MTKPTTMPRSLLEHTLGRPLWMGVVVLKMVLAAAATVLCAGGSLDGTGSMRSMQGVLIAVPALSWVTVRVSIVVRVRADGALSGNKGLGFSDEPERWDELVQETVHLPDWTRPYLEAVRLWEAGRGNPWTPRLRLV